MVGKYEREIINALEMVNAGSGLMNYEIFDDWLELVKASLEAMPNMAKQKSEGKPFEDTTETKALFEKMRNRYKPESFERFSKAFSWLLFSVTDWQDVLGNVYMEWGTPSHGAGQFFTPFPICVGMAKMSMPDVEKEIHERIKKAAETDCALAALILAGSLCEPKDAFHYFRDRVLPVARPLVEPVTVCDPACGSGAMLIAAASLCPGWARDFGFVQFYGMDIDLTCVRMAQINCMLYGLNSFHMKCALNLSLGELEKLPEEYSSAYSEAITASRDDDKKTLEKAMTSHFTQGLLFDFTLIVTVK